MAPTGEEVFRTAPGPGRPPLDLLWSGPEGSWARAELPSAAANENAARGVLSAGRRVALLDCEAAGLLGCGPVRLGSTTVLRSVPDAPAPGGARRPAVGLALVQDAELPVAPGLALRAGLDVGDRLGVAAPLAAGGPGLAVKARVGVGGELGGIGLPVRLDLTLAVVRDVTPPPAGTRPEDCTGSLDIRWEGFVPLRLSASCGPGGTRLGFGLRGIF